MDFSKISRICTSYAEETIKCFQSRLKDSMGNSALDIFHVQNLYEFYMNLNMNLFGMFMYMVLYRK